MQVIAKQFKPYQGATPDPVAATREAMAHARAGQIPLVEAFYSLQGEGMRTGQATVFVRMAGLQQRLLVLRHRFPHQRIAHRRFAARRDRRPRA